MFVNYAHRGASEYAPENTLYAFYMGLALGATGIETDVQMTKDGVIVLFHDSGLERITENTGSISEYTYEELLSFDMGEYKGKEFKNEKIVTLDDFLKYFKDKDLTFAIELKMLYIEEEVLEIINRHNCMQKVIITSFYYDNLRRMSELDNTIKLGWLVQEITDDTISDAKKINCYQICPKAEFITAKNVEMARQNNLSVRAWGIGSTELMEQVCKSGVDGGMTINFPDKLHAYMSKNN